MSGGGGNDEQILGTALTIGAAIAAPELAPLIIGEGIAATAVTGAVLGGAASAITNRDPVQGAVLGGLGGAATGYMQGLGASNVLAGELSSVSPTYDVIGPDGVFTPMQAETGIPLQVGQSYTPGGNEYATLGPSGRYASADILNANGTTSPYVAGDRMSPNMTRAGADFPTVNSGVTQPMDGLANAGPGTQSGYQQIGANPQVNPNTTMSPEVGAKSTPNVNTDVKGTGLFGSGITGKQAMVGLGGLALWNAIQNENKKYGVPTTQTSVPANLNYTLAQHAPMKLTRSYAEGGPVAMPNMNNSPIKHRIAANSIGDNQMFPQPGIHSNQFANPTNTPVAANMLTPTMAAGGIAQSRLGGYAAGGNPHLLKGPGDGMSDNIPAMIGSKQPARLADGEFVVPADVVSHLGNGSTDAGAQKLHSMMNNVRKARTGKKAQGKQIKADKYMPKFADGGQVDPIAAAAQAAQAANQNFVAQQAPAIPVQAAPAQGLGATAPAQVAAPAPMAQQFADYQNRYAQQYAPTNENFVRQAYMHNLGRAPEQAGADYWNQQIQSGALTPQQVAQQIAGSQEATNAGNIRDAMLKFDTPPMTPGQINNLISSGYQGNLGRAPDAGGAEYYSKLLQTGQLTPQQFIDQLKASSEFTNKPTSGGGSVFGGGGGGGTLSDQDRFDEMMRNYQVQQNQNQNQPGG